MYRSVESSPLTYLGYFFILFFIFLIFLCFVFFSIKFSNTVSALIFFLCFLLEGFQIAFILSD